ncbi:hypothetical protein XW60_19125 [Mycobacteroides abscessus subsp. bolletii]|nr:hypothetical protein XW60_19125 [Mycobacteroides abscessus subsp. bolletii]
MSCRTSPFVGDSVGYARRPCAQDLYMVGVMGVYADRSIPVVVEAVCPQVRAVGVQQVDPVVRVLLVRESDPSHLSPRKVTGGRRNCLVDGYVLVATACGGCPFGGVSPGQRIPQGGEARGFEL